jgi:hypothetical protein
LKKTPAPTDPRRRQGFTLRPAFSPRIAAWLLALCLPAISSSAADVPTGIYVLGSARNNPATSRDDRLGNIRDYDFVSGYTLRLFWSDLEPAPGQYEFGVLDEALQKLSVLGQGLNVEVFTNAEPDWLLSGVSPTSIIAAA